MVFLFACCCSSFVAVFFCWVEANFWVHHRFEKRQAGVRQTGRRASDTDVTNISFLSMKTKRSELAHQAQSRSEPRQGKPPVSKIGTQAGASNAISIAFDDNS